MPDLRAWFLGLLIGSLPMFAQEAGTDLRAARTRLAEAVLTEDAAEQAALVQKLPLVADPLLQQALGAWRLGSLYLYEPGDGRRIPFVFDNGVDGEGRSKALSIIDGLPLKDADGREVVGAAGDYTAVDTSSRLRKAIKTTLDLVALASPDERVRHDAIRKLGQEQNPEYLPHFLSQREKETVPAVRRTLDEAIALTRMASDDPAVRVPAIRALGTMHALSSSTFLKELGKSVRREPERFGAETERALHDAMLEIETYEWWANLFGTAFRGLSLSAVLLVVALGLAITFGLMGIINMAHGEIMMVGAYTAFVIQNTFQGLFGSAGAGFDAYFVAAIPASFLSAALVGIALERGIIRFLYRRPLESMLATWGVSLVLQQLFRHGFGAANVQVSSPRWLSGSFVIHDVLLAYNRIFVIGFALFIVAATWLVLTRTSMGLQVRAVMQNRSMAACLGVRTDRVNMVTFAFGSGLAGMAGACLSQIGNVGPSLGQNYIVDCFMIVVLGGVGNLAGTVAASFGVGVTDQILQPWLGAVMGKITVLAAIILFLQWRPSGLFVTRSRSLEG